MAEKNRHEVDTYWRPHVRYLEEALAQKTAELSSLEAAICGASAWLASVPRRAS